MTLRSKRSETEPFGRSAEWYDRFHPDKDYASEVRYLLAMVRRQGVSPKRWLDVGCGTGRHVAHLRSHGVAVEGVDSSPAMIARARLAHPGIPFHVASASEFRLEGERDVVSLLFHAFSYLTSDEVILSALRCIGAHLRPEGVLVFDFWHTPAVLRDPPASRTRSARIGGRTLFRIAHPETSAGQSVVAVRFEFRWDSPEGEPVHSERHEVRHFTRADLERLLDAAGMRPVTFEAWHRDRPLTDDDWYGVVCARRVLSDGLGDTRPPVTAAFPRR